MSINSDKREEGDHQSVCVKLQQCNMQGHSQKIKGRSEKTCGSCQLSSMR